jgi:hypothetical protein
VLSVSVPAYRREPFPNPQSPMITGAPTTSAAVVSMVLSRTAARVWLPSLFKLLTIFNFPVAVTMPTRFQLLIRLDPQARFPARLFCPSIACYLTPECHLSQRFLIVFLSDFVRVEHCPRRCPATFSGCPRINLGRKSRYSVGLPTRRVPGGSQSVDDNRCFAALCLRVGS